MRKLLPYKKDKRKSIDLKIPIPLVGGIQNAKLAEWQLDALLTSGQQQHPTKEESMVAKGNSMREGVKKTGSSISTFEPRAQAAIPTRPISSPPALAMPNPRRLLLPPDLVLRGEDLDKTEIETVTSRSDEDAHRQDVVVLWPHNWKEIPSYTQQERIPRPGDSNDLWASGSEDYVSALQSPLVSEDHQIINFSHPSSEDNHSTPRVQRQPLNPIRGRTKENGQQPVQPFVVAQQPPQPLRYQQQQQQQNAISLEDLKQQVDMIQLQRAKERYEWERREMEHRKREKEMLDRIQDTQRRLERVLANRSNHNDDQNGIINGSSSSTTTTNTNKTNGTAFSYHRYATRKSSMEDEDVLQGYDYYYHYYPYMQQEKRQQQQTPSLRQSSAPGSPEGDYHSAMEEFPDAAHRQKQKQRQDDTDFDSADDAEDDNEEPVMDQPRRRRHSYVNEDGIHYATFPSHVRRPRPHVYMTPSAAAVHRGGGRSMPHPQMLMFDDCPAWPPPPPTSFPPRRHRFGPSTPTTPSTAYPENYQDEYRPFSYPFLHTSSSSSRMHHRTAIAPSVPVPMFHHHRSADGPPPPPPPASMGYR